MIGRHGEHGENGELNFCFWKQTEKTTFNQELSETRLKIDLEVIDQSSTSRRCLSRSIMCESWNNCLGWSPGNEVLERKIMLEQIMALMEINKAVIQYIPSRNLSCSNPLGEVG